MFGLCAFVCFLVALIINLLVKGTDVKFATDFLYAGLAFLALHVTWSVYPWRHGGAP